MKHDGSTGKGDHERNSGGPWRSVWRGLRISRKAAVVLLLVVSLAANATLFVGGVLYNVIDEALTKVAGLETATSRQRKSSDDLKRKNRQLNERNRNLRNRATRLHKVTSGAVNSTVARSTRGAARAVATAPAKALPYVGTTVVVGAAAWEIKGHCDTIRDMTTIQREVDNLILLEPEPSKSRSEGERTVCGMDVPTREEIWNQIRTAPLAVWHHSRDFLTDLEPISPGVEVQLAGWWENRETLVRDGWDGLRQLLTWPD